MRQDALPDDPLAAADGIPQHLLTLASVEDDALGAELRVIWEIEPGARAIERSALPAPTRFDAFLDALRWGAAASADTKTPQPPFRSSIVTEDDQLEPVVRAVQMPRVNLLIADDVASSALAITGAKPN